MSASLDQSRTQQLRAAAEYAPEESRPEVSRLLHVFYRHTATEDLLAREPEDLLGAALAERDLARQRAVGTVNVAVTNPSMESQGWASGHTIVQVVTDDMPFLVDSVTAALGTLGRTVHLVVHPQLVVRRDAIGTLEHIYDDETPATDEFGVVTESWMHLEVDRVASDEEREEISARLRAVLGNVRDAVEDWSKMRERASSIAVSLHDDPPKGIDDEEVGSTARFLEWLANDHFTFLGYREYTLVADDQGEDMLSPVSGTGLGILRYDRAATEPVARLNPSARKKAREPELLIITKANSRATVHRSTYLDYIGVKVFDEQGRVTGERRFLGIFASSAYAESILHIPILAERVAHLLERAGFTPDSHSGKDLVQVMENYPRDELLQTDPDELLEIATSVLHLQERRKTRLFLRYDIYERFVSALIYLPRDRYNTTVRLKMEDILRRTFNAESVDYTTRVSESALARLHFVVRVPKGAPIPEVDESALEREVVEATRTWDEDLVEALRADVGDEAGGRLIGLYGKAFPEAYKEDVHPRVAVTDIRRIEMLDSDDAVEVGLHQEPGCPPDERRFKLYRRGPLTLTRVLPMFTHLGVEITDERPYEITRSDGVRVYVYDFGLRTPHPEDWGSSGDRDARRLLLQNAVRAVWTGAAESDGFNALVLGAGLTWRQVVILRMVAKYLRQTRSTFSQDYVEAALVANPAISRMLVELFETRFDPQRYAGEANPERAEAEATIADAVLAALDEVSSLDQDRIIRALLGVVQAALRTNFYQSDSGGPKPYVSLKLDPTKVPDLPAPRPKFEIWVYGPRVEGVHLRFGKVARGGLRWSDRREDFRTEILGLVKAQMVKNAVIVPTGSKGGFFAKQLPDPTADRDAWLAEGVAAYELFISGLLDLTDNRVQGEAIPPPDVVRHDGDDTYLVVAADKGTATFSDIANAKAQEYGYWLDDAFASGGSAGYDHKAMGITARGAWESVKRHFREMGVDTQTQDFTVVGVGDMSGDVFGNGMLLSEHIRLLAAFDHRHVFVDPNPDAASSYAERRRLFELPRSSWAEYDRSLISAGGGVFDRAAKSVPISAEMAAALGLPKDTANLTPAELIHAILLAPADLLWNGGIGTYVKASTETNADIGDRANDAIRVDGNALRVKVIGEGGNLGCSQLGRVEAALHEVRVNTDAIDNSAGVDTSDHEVNIKIPLTALVRDGDLTLKQRNHAAAVDDRRRRRRGAARQLRAERAARQRSGAAVLDASRAPAAHPLARGARRPQPVPGVPAVRRRDRQAPRRQAGPQVARVLGPRLLRQARAQAGPHADGARRRPVVPADPGRVLPGADARGVCDAARRAPAAPGDHHQRRRQLDGQPGRDHVRVPGRRGDRRRAGADRPRVRRVPRGVRDVVLRGGGRGARQRGVDVDADGALPRVPAAAGPGLAVVPLGAADQHRRRRRGGAVPGSGRPVRAAHPRGAAGFGTAAGGAADQGAGEARRAVVDRGPRGVPPRPLLAARRRRPRRGAAAAGRGGRRRVLLRVGEVRHRRHAHPGQQAAA